MSTLGVTTAIESSIPWWAILLIVVGVIVLAIIGVVSGHFISKKIRYDTAVQNLINKNNQ